MYCSLVVDVDPEARLFKTSLLQSLHPEEHDLPPISFAPMRWSHTYVVDHTLARVEVQYPDGLTFMVSEVELFEVVPYI